MASQKLYASTTLQLEEAFSRLQEAVQNLEWDRALCEASIIAALARVLVDMMPELEEN